MSLFDDQSADFCIPANFFEHTGVTFQYMMAKKLFQAAQWQEHLFGPF